MKKIILLVTLSYLFSACGTSWAIRRDQDGGKIGYDNNFPSQDAMKKSVISKIHCPDSFEIVSEEKKSSQSQVYIPVTNQEPDTNISYYGQSGEYLGKAKVKGNEYQSYQAVPTTNYWTEITYKCSGSSDSRQPSSSQENDVNYCMDQWKKYGESFEKNGYTIYSFLMDCKAGKIK